MYDLYGYVAVNQTTPIEHSNVVYIYDTYLYFYKTFEARVVWMLDKQYKNVGIQKKRREKVKKNNNQNQNL